MNEKTELENLAKNSKNILIEVKAVWPFDLFPNRIIVDQTKMTIQYNHFFFMKREFPILIEDIKAIAVTSGPLFASARIEIQGYEQNPEPLEWLPKNKTYELKDLVTGLSAAHKQEIDIQQHNADEIRSIAKEIGGI